MAAGLVALRRRLGLVLLVSGTGMLACLVAPNPSFAQDDASPREQASTPASSAQDEQASAPASSQVYGARARVGRSPEHPVSASEQRLELGALREIPRRQAEQYLTLVPGLVLANHSGVGHASSIFLRGFDAGEGEDIEVLVDGVPVNEISNAHAHGYADTLFVIPEAVSHVHVLPGPFDLRQGDFALAGSVRYELGMPVRGVRARTEYGSFAERRALLTWGPHDEAIGTFAAVDLRDGDGFGPNRAHASASTLARYESRHGALRYHVLGAAHALTHDSAGVIREEDLRASRLPCGKSQDEQIFCTYDPHQGGSAARQLLHGGIEWQRSRRRFQLHAYLGRRQFRERSNFTGFLLDARGDGLDQRYEATTFGLGSEYEIEELAWGRRHRLALGFDARHDDARTRAWRMRREGGEPYQTVFDTELAPTRASTYLRAELAPLTWLALITGVRADVFAFSSVDLDRESSDRMGERLPVSGRDAFGTALSPRVSTLVHLTPELDLVASAGSGVRSSDAQALSDRERAPFARAVAVEVGPRLTLEPSSGVRIEAAAHAHATRVTQDLLFDPERGRNVPIGPSRRYGVASSLRVRASRWSDTLASFAWSEARAEASDASIFDLGSGPRLPYVPRVVARLDHASELGARLAGEVLALRPALGASFVGPYPLPFGASSQSVLSIDASVSARVRLLELGLMVQNLFDARNRSFELEYPSNFVGPGASVSMRAARHLAAAPPRRFLITLTLYLDEPRAPAEPV